MSARPPKNSSADAAPQSVPQVTPPAIGYGHPEYHFIQSTMEMQKSLGEVNASIANLTKSVDSVKAKVDDLVKWKYMIVGGAFTVGVLTSIFIFLANKLSEYITISPPSSRPSQIQQPVAPPPPQASPNKK